MNLSTLLVKAARAVSKYIKNASSRGSVSGYVPDVNSSTFGQPRDALGDASGIISPDRMREVVMRVGTVAACVNATLDYVNSVRIDLRNTNHALSADPTRLMSVKSFMQEPNTQDTWDSLRYKVERDMVICGYGALEIERDEFGRPANLWPLDSAKLFIDFDEHGTILGYNMLDARGNPIRGEDGSHTWLPQDVLYFPRDPSSASAYGTSRITQLFALAILEDLMISFISSRFTDSNVPYGLLDLGDITEQELELAVDSWNSQAKKEHKIILTGSKGGSKWFPFAYALKDLEAPALLNAIQSKIMSILGVTQNELGETQDVNKSNGFNLSYTFKKRAIEPVLRIECAVFTRHFIWRELGYRDLEAYADEIDSRDELLEAQIDDMYLKMGAYSFNHLRNKKGQPSTPGGDEPCVFTGSAWIPIRLIAAFAEAQLSAIIAVDTELSSNDGAAGKLVSPPLIRGPKMPESYTTPGGSGSSTPQIRYPQKPRGAVQTLRNTGVRREELA